MSLEIFHDTKTLNNVSARKWNVTNSLQVTPPFESLKFL